MGYIINNKFKSLNLLLPLTELPKDRVINTDNKLIHTYCYWNNTEESIEDYLLLVLFLTTKDDADYQRYCKNVLNKNKNLISCYETNKGQLHVFTLIDKKATVDKFMTGKYSKFSDKDKKLILDYWKEKNNDEACELYNDFPTSPRHVILYPQFYFEEVAKELGMSQTYLESVGELWSMPDKTTETLDCRIIEGTDEKCNQLALELV